MKFTESVSLFRGIICVCIQMSMASCCKVWSKNKASKGENDRRNHTQATCCAEQYGRWSEWKSRAGLLRHTYICICMMKTIEQENIQINSEEQFINI